MTEKMKMEQDKQDNPTANFSPLAIFQVGK